MPRSAFCAAWLLAAQTCTSLDSALPLCDASSEAGCGSVFSQSPAWSSLEQEVLGSAPASSAERQEFAQDPGRASRTCLTGSVRSASLACQHISKSYGDYTFFPGQTSYEAEIEVIWSQHARKNPGCIVIPPNPETLAQVLGILAKTDVAFAVASGGHMPVSGFNAFGPGGITLSTRNLNDMEVVNESNDFGESYVRAGAAFTWDRLYGFLDKKDLYVAGARVSGIGSALLLGGGLSYFSSTSGWAANNVINFEVALANGSLIEVNSKRAPDLFWALKGASNNFGIVTRYDIRTYPSRPLWGGLVVWGSENTQRYLDAEKYFALPGGGSEDPKAAIMAALGYTPATKTNFSSSMLLYQDPVKPKAFENFTAIPDVMNTCEITTLSGIIKQTEFYAEKNKRWIWGNLALKISDQTMDLIYKAVQEVADELLPHRNCTVGAGIQPITQSHLHAARNLGGDALDLDPDKGPFVIAMIYAQWFEADDDSIAELFLKKALSRLEADAKSHDILYPWLYLNDAAGFQDPIAWLGYGRSHEKLLGIARKYDPNGVFQKAVPGFKIDGALRAC